MIWQARRQRMRFEDSYVMAGFIMDLARPGAVVPIPPGTNAKSLMIAFEMAQDYRRQRYGKMRYDLQADGIYEP